MGNTSEDKGKRNVSIGLLAHVDAGKTTLSEALLYTAGAIRKLGRVDHKDAFLDTYELERNRGITIFSKQAVMGPGRFSGYFAGYAGACGFFRRDGANASGAGL